MEGRRTWKRWEGGSGKGVLREGKEEGWPRVDWVESQGQEGKRRKLWRKEETRLGEERSPGGRRRKQQKAQTEESKEESGVAEGETEVKDKESGLRR